MGNKSNDGVEFEKFVQLVQQIILDSNEDLKNCGINTVSVKHNLRIPDKNGLERQFDLYWEYVIDGKAYKNIIECKDYKNAVSVDRIDSVCGKLIDFPGFRAIVATSSHFQSGAIEKAKNNGIGLIVVRKKGDETTSDSLWVDEAGDPVLHKIEYHLNIISRNIEGMRVDIDRRWAEAHGIENESEIVTDIDYRLEDASNGLVTSLFAYLENIKRSYKGTNNVYREAFQNTYLVNVTNGERIRIEALEIVFGTPSVDDRVITVKPNIIGTVDDIIEGTKKAVIENGTHTGVVYVCPKPKP